MATSTLLTFAHRIWRGLIDGEMESIRAYCGAGPRSTIILQEYSLAAARGEADMAAEIYLLQHAEMRGQAVSYRRSDKMSY